jgi:predicted  nucleic acid-binding Zn-ribbon protein
MGLFRSESDLSAELDEATAVDLRELLERLREDASATDSELEDIEKTIRELEERAENVRRRLLAAASR